MSEPDRLIRKVTLPLDPGAECQIPAALADGMMNLRFDGSNHIVLTYDLRRTSLPALETWLGQFGLPLASGFWHRLKRRWMAFKDDNRRDQAAIVHQCCSVPPPKE